MIVIFFWPSIKYCAFHLDAHLNIVEAGFGHCACHIQTLNENERKSVAAKGVKVLSEHF